MSAPTLYDRPSVGPAQQPSQRQPWMTHDQQGQELNSSTTLHNTDDAEITNLLKPKTCAQSVKDWFSDCWVRYRTPMTPREYLRLNAWQKWHRFRRPPWKFIMNLLIVICATAQVMLFDTYFAPFSRATTSTWEYLLTPPNPASEQFGTSVTYHMYRVEDLVESVKNTLQVYFTAQESSVDYFDYFYVDNDPKKPQPVRLLVTRFRQGPSIFDLSVPFSDRMVTDTFELNSPDDLGPFDINKPEDRDFQELNAYVHCLHKMQVEFDVRNYELAGSTRLCYRWEIATNYDFSVRGRIDMKIEATPSLCPQERRVPWYRRAIPSSVILSFLLAILAAISQVLHVKAIYRSIIIFQVARLASTLPQRKTKSDKSSSTSLFPGENATVDDDLENDPNVRRLPPESLAALSTAGVIDPSRYRAGTFSAYISDGGIRSDPIQAQGQGQVLQPDEFGSDYVPPPMGNVQTDQYERLRNEDGETEEKKAQNGDVAEYDEHAIQAQLESEVSLRSWAKLSFADKLRFFNMWFLVATVGNVCNIVGPLLMIREQVLLEGSSLTRLSFLGLGCMMAWINVVQYFEGAASYYVLITTLRKGTPRVARFLVGVLPVFLGYAMFGVAFFSTDSINFATIDMACVTLFSLLNGDVIHDIFDELYATDPWISRIYLYTFICLFIYAVLNIFIAIIEDAFFASKAFQLHGQPALEDKEKSDQVDPLLLLEFEGMFGDDDDSSSDDEDAVQEERDSKSSSSTSSSSSSSTSSSSSDSEGAVKNRRRRRKTRRPPTIPGYASPRSSGSDNDNEQDDGNNDSERAEARRLRRKQRQQQKQQQPESEQNDPSQSFDMGALITNSTNLRSTTSNDQSTSTNLNTTGLQTTGLTAPDSFTIQEMASQAANWPSLNSQDLSQSLATSVAGADGSAVSSATSSGVPSDLVSALTQAQASLNADFTARFASFLASAQAQQKVLRPPHHPSFFPCGFPDCVACIIRVAAAKTMSEAQVQLQQAFGIVAETSSAPSATSAIASSQASASNNGPTSIFSSTPETKTTSQNKDSTNSK